MKTPVNKLKREQAFSNKVVFFYLLIFGIIVFSTSGINSTQHISDYSEKTPPYFNTNTPNSELETTPAVYSNNKKRDSDLAYISPIEAELSTDYHCNLEMNRLDEKMTKNSLLAYRQMLNALANVEEPELLIEDVLLQMDIQAETFNANQPTYFIQKQNAYLNELYKQKNHEVLNEIEQAHQFNKILMAENESNINIESWMMDETLWVLTAEENRDIEQDLAEMYAQKNAEVFESIENEMNLRNWAITDSDEPLRVEAWMAENYEKTFATSVVKNEHLATMVNSKINEVDEMIELLKRARCCGIIEKEEPLAVESWMVSERCWCPNKKQTKNIYNESFAMSDTK